MMSLYKTRELVDALQADINREMDRARRRASEVIELRAQRDEARRDACSSEVRADMLSHYNGHEPDEDEILTKARELAVEKGWDCFEEAKP